MAIPKYYALAVSNDYILVEGQGNTKEAAVKQLRTNGGIIESTLKVFPTDEDFYRNHHSGVMSKEALKYTYNLTKKYNLDRLSDKDFILDLKKENLFDSLSSIKSQLFDAPAEVKSAFNDVVEYFSFNSAKKNFLKNPSSLTLSMLAKAARDAQKKTGHKTWHKGFEFPIHAANQPIQNRKIKSDEYYKKVAEHIESHNYSHNDLWD